MNSKNGQYLINLEKLDIVFLCEKIKEERDESMKKAGIITIYGDYENYGNRLQNYAVQECLKKLNLDPFTIKYMHIGAEEEASTIDYNLDRLAAFKDFNDNIKFYDEKIYVDRETPEGYGNDLDYVCIGSDQIWNYNFRRIFSRKAFADFMPKVKKMAFSASIGVSNAPDKDTEDYKIFAENLNEFKAISVREEAAKDIIKEISGRDDVKVVLDPTMIVTREDWEKVIKRPKQLKTDNYIVKCFLGTVEPEKEAAIQKFAKENGCEVIDVMSEDSEYFGIGPAEFVYLEKNAKLVATDSFHSSVFAIIFDTPFVVFQRSDNKLKSMHSRIETLLGTFKLEHRIFENEITDDMFRQEDNEVAQKILAEKRKDAMDYFKTVLV